MLDISNEWFILLSESCIPLHNFSVIYHYIKKSKYSFIDSFDDPGPVGRGRYNESMAPEVTLTQWRKGSQWFEINRRLAINIVEDIKYYPKFERFCRPECYVDEHYFPTMLAIQASNLLANRSITWVDWSRGGAHPATFGSADITEEFFIRINEAKECRYNNQPSSICFLFARKFAPNALEPLLEIEPKASLILVFVAVLALAGSAIAAEAPAPSPTSGTGSISPSFAVAVFAAASALIFGSSVRI
ncbi:hypothetical protein V6N12_052293 [Hibiscus sabdariffa]|uniref:Uncharacterized protein n=1 Tax=Hibiscus sabdariffa TaxID=183260 RepID=A0ABR2GHT9_9ROSI